MFTDKDVKIAGKINRIFETMRTQKLIPEDLRMYFSDEGEASTYFADSKIIEVDLPGEEKFAKILKRKPNPYKSFCHELAHALHHAWFPEDFEKKKLKRAKGLSIIDIIPHRFNWTFRLSNFFYARLPLEKEANGYSNYLLSQLIQEFDIEEEYHE